MERADYNQIGPKDSPGTLNGLALQHLISGFGEGARRPSP